MADYVRELAGGVVAVVICENDYLYGTELDRAYALAESYEPEEEYDPEGELEDDFEDDPWESDLDEDSWSDYDPEFLDDGE